MTVCIGSGNQRSIDAAARLESLISSGVVRMVIADTAIATGYIQTPITPDATPTLAMMNENSPIWARLIPAFIAVRRP